MLMIETTENKNVLKKNFEIIHQRSPWTIFHYRPAWMRRIIWGIICPAGVGGHAGLFGQRLHSAEMSLCLFKGQRNQWPQFLRHGSDLLQWHEYQSRGGSPPRLAARRICLWCRRPCTAWMLVYLLSMSGRVFRPASSWPVKVLLERY